jgi:transcription-repair coupling factor (superfamily II helicase)
MRQELTDRFGEYPEEVEHLFCLIELKILASSMRVTKVELVQSTLKLFFPPPEEKSFYEGDLAPFQRYARRMQEAKAIPSRLKQEGKQMFLELRLPKTENEKDRLARVRQYLDFLNLPE